MPLYILDLINGEIDYFRRHYIVCKPSDVSKVHDIFKNNMKAFFDDPDGELDLRIFTKSKHDLKEKGIKVKFIDPLSIEVINEE